jgi:hypothetical protein
MNFSCADMFLSMSDDTSSCTVMARFVSRVLLVASAVLR